MLLLFALKVFNPFSIGGYTGNVDSVWRVAAVAYF